MLKAILLALCVALTPTLALSKVVGKSTGTQGSVLLTDEPCQKGPGLRLIVIDNAAKKLDEGCWVKGNGQVGLYAEILGAMALPEDAFDWFEKDSTRNPNT